jgi:hypothetical protein
LFEFLTDYFKPRKKTELDISWRGQKVFDNFVEKEITPKDIFDIQQEQGYDVAAWVLYKALREKENFLNFSTFVEGKKDKTYSAANKEILVFVIAHNPWVSLKDNEEYQWRLKNMVLDAGFDFYAPEISYRRSIFANAYKYQEIFKRFAGRKVIFLTHSLAGLELRWFLEKSIDIQVDVQGWLNLSGMIYGTSLPPSSNDWFLSAKRFIYDEYPVKAEVLRSNAYCYGDLKTPRDLPMVSVVGFPPPTSFGSERAKELKFWGPHDGFVTLADYLKTPGVVWPIWNDGHFITVENQKKRLQASLHYLCSEASLIKSPQR